MILDKTMKNGVRVVAEPMPGMRSVAIGVWVDTGSVRERGGEAGASHFIEHMLFKGTERRSAEEIACEMDAIGGNLNAFTSKECTCFYARVLDEHLPVAVELLSDIVLHSRFDPEELEKEKGVVIEEILMTQDSPEDLVAETANELFFGDDPLAHPILGTQQSVRGFTRDSLLGYMDEHYVPKNMVIACAGHFEEERLLSLLEAHFQPEPSERSAGPLEQAYAGGRRFRCVEKDVEQAHITLMLPGFARDTAGQFPLSVLSNALGGSMSSRLFQTIRERLGLAYSVYSYPLSYTKTGSFALYAGTGEKQAVEVTKRMLEEIANLREHGLREEEFVRCREQLKGSWILGMESSSAHMNTLGKLALLQKRVYNEQDTLRRIEAVTQEDIQAILSICLDTRHLSAAFVGRMDDGARSALEKLCKG
ncbi:MAG: pitrilysin family protein [Clostridia bacterium]|nr:pitrilysin family protein [Clostridia bacterium]